MTDALIRWSLRNRAAILLVAVLLTAFGAWRTSAMPVDVFPDLTAPTVTVLTDVHGMAPTEVEVQVTFPIESALNGAAGVRRVRSSTISTPPLSGSAPVVRAARGRSRRPARLSTRRPHPSAARSPGAGHRRRAGIDPTSFGAVAKW